MSSTYKRKTITASQKIQVHYWLKKNCAAFNKLKTTPIGIARKAAVEFGLPITQYHIRKIANTQGCLIGLNCIKKDCSKKATRGVAKSTKRYLQALARAIEITLETMPADVKLPDEVRAAFMELLDDE